MKIVAFIFEVFANERLQNKNCLKRNSRTMISARVSNKGRCLTGVSRRMVAKIRLYYLMIIFDLKMIFTSLKYVLQQNMISLHSCQRPKHLQCEV